MTRGMASDPHSAAAPWRKDAESITSQGENMFQTLNATSPKLRSGFLGICLVTLAALPMGVAAQDALAASLVAPCGRKLVLDDSVAAEHNLVELLDGQR